MENKTVDIKEKRISDTTYIVESVASNSATETIENKLKRLMLNDTNLTPLKTAS